MDPKRKLKGIADLYAVEDARKSHNAGITAVTPVTTDTGVTPDTPVPLVKSTENTSKTIDPDPNTSQIAHYNYENSATETVGTPVTPVPTVPHKDQMHSRGTGVTPLSSVINDAAPKRDFARVANSIVREAIPSGVFT